MAASYPNALLLAALAAPFGMPAARAAEPARAQQLPITLDAQSIEGGLNGVQNFHKVRIEQGAMSITADLGQATGVDFDNSVWVFRGNVKVGLPGGQLASDDAQITFADKQLQKAVVKGRPATFEQRIEKTGRLAQGRAESIDYDVRTGLVHLSHDAWVSDGQREIRGESLKYNLVAQSIAAEGSEQSSQRVHVVITPPTKP